MQSQNNSNQNQGDNLENQSQTQIGHKHSPRWIAKDVRNQKNWRVKHNGFIPEMKKTSNCHRCRQLGYKYRVVLESLDNCDANPHYVCFKCAAHFIVEEDQKPIKKKEAKQIFISNLKDNYKRMKEETYNNASNQESQVVHSSSCNHNNISMSSRFSYTLATTQFLHPFQKYLKKSVILKRIYRKISRIAIHQYQRFTFKNQRDAKVCAVIAGYNNIKELPSFVVVPQSSDPDSYAYHSDAEAQLFKHFLQIYSNNCEGIEQTIHLRRPKNPSIVEHQNISLNNEQIPKKEPSKKYNLFDYGITRNI